jgi:hypothetical protein
MNAPPTDFIRSPSARLGRDSALDSQWAALNDAAAAVATLAGLAAERPDARMRNFPALINDVGGWRLDLATNGVTDLSAMMRPGLRALVAVSERGQDPTPAAVALWREFHHARAALLALLPHPD